MEQTDRGKDGKSFDEKNPAEKKKADLEVEIRQYQTLLEILDKPKSTLKVIFARMFFALALFMALAFTAIAIKRFYPYNEIKTNAFGATTMQNEEVELTYWLFNTAELWADSGIKVKRGDVLTIRASGKSNTSIHHLVDHAFYNARPRYAWVGTEGQPRSANTRTEYRIYPDRDPDALILQVVPEKKELGGEYLRPDFVTRSKKDRRKCREDAQERFYYIGKERTDLRINQEGTLRFAVNDIVLTPRCIDSMQWKNDLVFRKLYKDSAYMRLLSLRCDSLQLARLWHDRSIPRAPDASDEILHSKVDSILRLRKECNRLKEFYKYLGDHIPGYNNPEDETLGKLARYFGTEKEYPNINPFIPGKNGKERCDRLLDDETIRQGFRNYCDSTYRQSQVAISALLKDPMLHKLCSLWRNANDLGLYFGPHPVPLISGIDEGMERISPLRMPGDTIRVLVYPFYNEMTYYRDAGYYNAWFDDNIGTFLIVVERRKN